MSPSIPRHSRPMTVVPGTTTDRGYVTINGVCPWCLAGHCEYHKDEEEDEED